MKRNKAVVIFAVIAAALVIGVVVSALQNARFDRWASTGAVVSGWTNMHSRSVRVDFSYTVDGVQYSGFTVYPRSGVTDKKASGEQVVIWYNPENPAQSSYHKPSGDIELYAPLFLAIPICLAVFTVMSRNEDREKYRG